MAKSSIVVNYMDGSWTENLSLAHYGLSRDEQGVTLTIELTARERPGKVRLARQALRDFVEKRLKVDTIQIGKPRFTARLRNHVRGRENAQLDLQLSADGVAVAYPAWVFFGPDVITLNLG